MTITKGQADQWDAEVKDAYQRGYEAGKSAASEPVQGVEMPEPVGVTVEHGDDIERVAASLDYGKSFEIKSGTKLVTLDQCQHAVAAAVARERQRILQCYSPDDTVNDYQDKIRSGK